MWVLATDVIEVALVFQSILGVGLNLKCVAFGDGFGILQGLLIQRVQRFSDEELVIVFKWRLVRLLVPTHCAKLWVWTPHLRFVSFPFDGLIHRPIESRIATVRVIVQAKVCSEFVACEYAWHFIVADLRDLPAIFQLARAYAHIRVRLPDVIRRCPLVVDSLDVRLRQKIHNSTRVVAKSRAKILSQWITTFSIPSRQYPVVQACLSITFSFDGDEWSAMVRHMRA